VADYVRAAGFPEKYFHFFLSWNTFIQ
jgi:hypothetical protein